LDESPKKELLVNISVVQSEYPLSQQDFSMGNPIQRWFGDINQYGGPCDVNLIIPMRYTITPAGGVIAGLPGLTNAIPGSYDVF
jgi:hypothetical protein